MRVCGARKWVTCYSTRPCGLVVRASASVLLGSDFVSVLNKTLWINTVAFLPDARCAEELREQSLTFVVIRYVNLMFSCFLQLCVSIKRIWLGGADRNCCFNAKITNKIIKYVASFELDWCHFIRTASMLQIRFKLNFTV